MESHQQSMPDRILVTGAAGFIGFHVCQRLLQMGHHVAALDNLNDYYAVTLKKDRLRQISSDPQLEFAEIDLSDRSSLQQFFAATRPNRVIHLAAQAGVRYSLTNPHAYANSNLSGFLNVLESCRMHSIQHLVYASSSSVYGANTSVPFSVHQNVDHPVSLYAATKKANELMAHAYAALYGMPCTGLRFFTVYGPWGRPDMALFLFTDAILQGRPINVFNSGHLRRDFTYIDDVVEGIVRVLGHVATPDPAWNGDYPDPASSFAPYRVYNIGNNRPVELLRLIELLEESLGQKAIRNLLPMQPGDLVETYADISDLFAAVGYRPSTTIEEGVSRFVAWYRDYYSIAV